MMDVLNITKKLPVGIESFQKIRSEGFYYVDKTAMIRDLLNAWGEVNLFTRPRRFGKTLNMSMLEAFFEIGCDRSLFDGLEISKETALCEKYMGKFPVVSISLKGVDAADYETARGLMVKLINEEARRLKYLLDSEKLSQEDKDLFARMLKKEMDDDTIICSLRELSELLNKHFEKEVIILIDEYDVPLAKANANGYYDRMVVLVRNMFNQALKTNGSLYFAVMTGCLRIAKESIFTGLNNLKMYTLLDAECDEYFGFTDTEVWEMLHVYGLSEYYEMTKEWYDGYLVADTNVYNPWDVINWCNQLLTSSNKVPKNYWANSSGNAELRRFIGYMGDGVTKTQLERLIAGQTVQKKIEEQLTYDTMYDSIENMWSLLFATGYLTQRGTPLGNMVRLAIPNAEVRSIFSDFIVGLFEKEVEKDGAAVSEFCRALKAGDTKNVECQLEAFMERTISIRDTAVRKEFKESFYHGILLGILSYKDGWSVDSNRESGMGYYDIAIEIEEESIGILIEVKYAENERFDEACEEAMKQIAVNEYTAEFREDDMQTILKYGIAYYKKKCRVVCEKENDC